MVEIADVEAALGKVRVYIDLLRHSEHLWNTNSYETPQWYQTESEIREQLPLVLRIADRADSNSQPS